MCQKPSRDQDTCYRDPQGRSTAKATVPSEIKSKKSKTQGPRNTWCEQQALLTSAFQRLPSRLHSSIKVGHNLY